MKRILLLITLLVAIVGLTSACSTTAPYAAIVNGHEITEETMDDEIQAITSNPLYAAALDSSLSGGAGGGGLQPGGDNTINAQYVAQLLYNRVLVTLIEQEVARNNVVVTPEMRSAAEETVRGELNDPALLDSLAANYREYLIDRQAKLSALLASRNTPEAQRKYYDANKAKFEQYCASHILVESEQKAQAIKAQLDAGGNFAEIAKAESIDNQGQGGSAAQGGELGCYSREELDSFVPEFRDGLLPLQQGQVSSPVQSQFGYHLILLTSKKQQTFEEAQQAISQQLQSASQFFLEALASARVKVNPRYGEFVPGDAARGEPARIVPHEATVLPEGEDQQPGDLDELDPTLEPQ